MDKSMADYGAGYYFGYRFIILSFVLILFMLISIFLCMCFGGIGLVLRYKVTKYLCHLSCIKVISLFIRFSMVYMLDLFIDAINNIRLFNDSSSSSNLESTASISFYLAVVYLFFGMVITLVLLVLHCFD